MPYADLSDVRCHYKIMGTGEPLLMIVGLGSTCEIWGSAAEQLAKSFTLILADNRNMGRSVGHRMPQCLADFSADYVELLEHLQLDRTHALGLSLGGIIAQRLAVDHPSRIDRLVLVSCTNRFGPYLRQVAKLLELTLRKFPFEMFRRTMEVLGTSPEYFDAHSKEIEAAASAFAGDPNQTRLGIARQLRCLACEEVAGPEEYRILSPTLVLAGERDMLIPSLYARQMADQIPGSEFYAIPECGHDPLQERPQIAVPRIVEFLSRGGGQRMIQQAIHEVTAALEEVH